MPGTQGFGEGMAAIGRTLLFCMIFVVSYSRPSASGGSEAWSGVGTPVGAVALVVQGMAKGFTNAELTRLIRAGVADAYPTRCDGGPVAADSMPRMVWHVVNDGRKPTAIVSVRVIQNGSLVRFAFSNAPAPDAFPDAVFRREVSDLARRVLAPPSVGIAAPFHC